MDAGMTPPPPTGIFTPRPLLCQAPKVGWAGVAGGDSPGLGGCLRSNLRSKMNP